MKNCFKDWSQFSDNLQNQTLMENTRKPFTERLYFFVIQFPIG